jgi:replicative DNA helicase
MHTDGDHIDQVTVTMRLANDGRIDEIGGHTGVFQLTDPIACPAPSAWRSYALIVADAADRRRLDLQLRRGLAQLADGAAPQAIRNQIAAA